MAKTKTKKEENVVEYTHEDYNIGVNYALLTGVPKGYFRSLQVLLKRKDYKSLDYQFGRLKIDLKNVLTKEVKDDNIKKDK